MKPVALLLAGLALGAAGIITVMVVPEQTQAVLSIESAGANQVVFPFGYWLAVSAWILVALGLLPGTPLGVVTRGVAVGMGLHVLLLLALFAPRLADRAAYSAWPYWMYSRAFTGGVLALATWRSIQAMRTCWLPTGRFALLDVPIAVGALVLATASARSDPPTAALGLTLGVVIASIGLLAPTAARRALEHARRMLGDERAFVAFVFILALALRILYLRQVMTNPNYLETGADGPIYDELAWSIARGQGIRASFTERFPLLLLGYVWFVSAIYKVAGHSYFAVGVLQSAIGAAACVLLHHVARDLFGVAVARVSMVFAAISFPLLFAAAAIGHQAIDVFLTMLVAWLVLRACKGGSLSFWRWALIGVVLGGAIAVRETGVFLLVFLIAWIPFAMTARSWALAARPIAAAVLGVGLVLAPLAAPMYSTPEKRMGLRAHLDRLYKGEADIDPTRTVLVGPLSAPGAAADQLVAQPRLVLGTLARAYARNIALQFFSQPYGGFDLVFLSKGSEYYYGLWFYVYALAAAGIVMAIRALRAGGTRAAGLALVLGVVVSRTLPHIVLESNFRHRVPIEPFLILLTAAAAVALATVARTPPATRPLPA